jgi:branched-chain amino acid transport system ATP-binding protein
LIQVLRDISLEVKTGEIVAVIGANGAGKTTLLRTISGIVPPHLGKIYFSGNRIDGLSADQIVRLGLCHVPERRELFDSLTVLDNLKLGAYHRKGRKEKENIQRDLENMWEIFPILRTRQRQMAGTLSGGEQQILAIARGLMAHPKLLMLDEPSLGLAPLLVLEVIRIVTLLREMGQTVLLVEQNASGTLQISDRAYLMETGTIVLQGTSLELMENDRVRRAYLGKQLIPIRQTYNSKPSNPEKATVSKISHEARSFLRKGGQKMDTKEIGRLPNTLSSYTLPDEYFEQRIGYSHEEIEVCQDETLPQAFSYAFELSPFYHAKFSEAGLTPESIRGLNDLAKIPFTNSEDIRSSPQHAFNSDKIVAVRSDEISLVHTSSGTTGAPKIFAYTGMDIARWASNTATIFWINGFRKNDIVLSVMPFGEFTGGGGLYLGMIALGVVYLPISLGAGVTDKVMAHLLGKIKLNNNEVQIDPLLRANGMVCLGSFLPRLEEMLDQYGVQPGALSLSKISAGAEPSSDAVRARIAERFGIWPKDNYGLGEFYGPGVAAECEIGGGLHVLSDAFIAEVVDPESGELVEEGEMGELVLTSLQKEAVPLFRYRTGDRVLALPNNCLCGNAHKWIGRVPGRIDTDDLMIPGGVVVNRTYLEDILLNIDGTGTQFAMTIADHPSRKGLKRLNIAIEGNPDPKLADTISRRILVEYNHNPVVTILPRGTIPRNLAKAKRILSPKEFFDLFGSYIKSE